MSVTSYEPGELYGWVTVVPLPVPSPAPKVQSKLVPPGDELSVKSTVEGALGLDMT